MKQLVHIAVLFSYFTLFFNFRRMYFEILFHIFLKNRLISKHNIPKTITSLFYNYILYNPGKLITYA